MGIEMFCCLQNSRRFSPNSGRWDKFAMVANINNSSADQRYVGGDALSFGVGPFSYSTQIASSPMVTVARGSTNSN